MLAFQERLSAPLWEIFSPGKRLDALCLGIRVLPLLENVSHETELDDCDHPLMQATVTQESTERSISHNSLDAEIPLDRSEHLFSASLETLPAVERPLAMATRLLETCVNVGSLRLLCLAKHSQCLFKFRHLVHIWVKVSVTTQAAMFAHGRELSSEFTQHSMIIRGFDRWLCAANRMRSSLMELASVKEDRKLEAGDVALLPQGRMELEPFADWLRNDTQVQKRVADAWNSVVREGQDCDLPPAFSLQLVNPPDASWDDEWIMESRHDYDRESRRISSDSETSGSFMDYDF